MCTGLGVLFWVGQTEVSGDQGTNARFFFTLCINCSLNLRINKKCKHYAAFNVFMKNTNLDTSFM